MFRIGAHVSISGGFPKAINREIDFGGNCGQIFSGSPRGWKVSQPDEEEAEEFRQETEEENVKPWIVHGTYLINFATPKEDLGKKSIEAVQAELNASAKLEIPYYVFHPGAHTGAGAEQGLQNIAERLSKLDIPNGVKLLLENTAGKGTTLGKTFEELRTMVEQSEYDDSKLGICLDSGHMYAAGYDINNDLDEIIEELDEVIGLENVQFLHLNDSKHPKSSEKDEHEHIGEGEIGEEGMKMFINHEKLRDKPMVLETPVDDKGFAWNIEKCKELREEE